MALQIGDTRAPFLDVSVYDGNTVVTLQLVSQALGTTTPLALTGPAAQGGGVGRWSAASYTFTAAGRWVERWKVTNAVTGLGAGAVNVELDVEADPPPLGPGQTVAWATVSQYAAIIGNPIPDNLSMKLRVATLQLKPWVSISLYDPAAAATTAALAEACCWQVKWAADNGWETGIPVAQRAVSIGSVSLGATNGSQAGGSGSVGPISPLAWQVLDAAGLIGAHIVTDAYPWWV
jgi:hypothetical protein